MTRSKSPLSDACCALRFYPHKEECSRVRDGPEKNTNSHFITQEIEEQVVEEQIQEERRITEVFGDTTIGRLRKKCWNITEYPETSLAAKVQFFNYDKIHFQLSYDPTRSLSLKWVIFCLL